MPTRRTWLPREGLTSDVVLRLFKNTALNATITLPLYILSHYTQRGQKLTAGHDVALRRLKLLVYAGIVRWLSNVWSARALNNATSSQYEWNKEVAVVTGGSGGIGSLVARLLAEKGVKVAILDIIPLTFEPTPNVHFFDCDITSPDAVSSTAASIRSTLGTPTILINNAGTAAGLPILSTTDASVQKVYDVNILSHFRLIREFVPAMVAANHGTVVTIASISAGVPPPSIVPYASTKSAAVALHEGLASELVTKYNAPKVRTICVCPGWVRTRMTVGINNPSTFLFPWQYPETVAEAIFERIVEGKSGMLFVPEIGWYLGWIVRTLPSWWQIAVRNDNAKYIPVDIAKTENVHISDAHKLGHAVQSE
ncbi:MAG: hypothetical protein Q9183_001498 [Haloplaca sp. 2 TL-2023]